MRTRTIAALATLPLLAVTLPAAAGSHLWRFSEIFSNADGSVMFIELVECCGAPNETQIANKDISSAATGMQFLFPAHLPCSNCTANERLLLATQSFADLAGAPTPDYIIEPQFFGLDGDTLTYWLYAGATWTYGADMVPVDGIKSLDRSGLAGVNSPTNFAGETGSVTAPCRRSDLDISGNVDVGDLLEVLGTWGPCAACNADLDESGGVDVTDLLQVLAEWGSC